jgi:NADPH:quinone reductase-like Zn-dependent oxidoreductase
MRAWEIRGSFGASSLALAERALPEPSSHEVLIAVRAVSLNYRDLLVIDGSYDPRLRLPHVPCSDACGEVIAIGQGVTRAKVGDRVIGSFAQRWIAGRPTIAKLRSSLGAPLPGVLATHVVLHEDGVVSAPEHLSDAAAATLPCAALTAWHALVDHGRLRAGETVLVQGTGGVSIAGLQIARAFGARVIATSSKPEKLERLRALGASETVDYRADPEWGKTVRALADRIGVDQVLEVGGPGTLAQSLRAVAPGGTVHLIGVLGGATERFDVLPAVMNEVRLQGIMVGPRESLEALCRAFVASRLEPIVDRVFAFDEAPAACAYLRSGAHFGKVCLAVG